MGVPSHIEYTAPECGPLYKYLLGDRRLVFLGAPSLYSSAPDAAGTGPERCNKKHSRNQKGDFRNGTRYRLSTMLEKDVNPDGEVVLGESVDGTEDRRGMVDVLEGDLDCSSSTLTSHRSEVQVRTTITETETQTQEAEQVEAAAQTTVNLTLSTETQTVTTRQASGTTQTPEEWWTGGPL
jgi:hypothetical protein